MDDKTQIVLPVAAQKTTVYTPVIDGYGDPWICTTNSAIVDLPENQERDEARAKKIAIALNHHDGLVSVLRKCVDALQYLEEQHPGYHMEIMEAEKLLLRIEQEVG